MAAETFLEEDIETVDITSEALLSEEKASGEILAKQDCVIAGIEEAVEIFTSLGLDTEKQVSDGDRVEKGQVVMAVSGRAKDILAGERLALNFMSRMSGIATETNILVERCTPINSNIRIAATRKTTPGFRKYEKKAVKLGGGEPHRFGLSDAFLIKDNHLKMVPSIAEAVRRAKESEWGKAGFPVEIEVETLEGAEEAAAAGADIIMLDNMKPREAKKGYRAIKSIDTSIIVEISGGVKPDTIEEYAGHADRISLGYLTHSVKAMDFSLEFISIND